jgi:transposase-like protein
MPPIKTEVLDELLSGVKSPDDLLGGGGVFRQLKKALMERALGAELTHHLGYEKGAAPTVRARGNSRNGHSAKNRFDRRWRDRPFDPARPCRHV